MKHFHIILELSDDQKEFQAFFQKMLKKFGVSSPAELKGDKKKEFFNAVDKGFKSDAEKAGIPEARDDFINRVKGNARLRRDLVRRVTPVVEAEDDEDPEAMTKGAANDPEISGKKSELVIEFPNDIRVQFNCKNEEVEDIKTRAQELHDEGLETTEVAAKVAEEFPGCTFEIEGGSAEEKNGKKNGKNDKNNKKATESKKKVRESFTDYVAGLNVDAGKVVRDRRNDRLISERVERYLQQLNEVMNRLQSSIQEASPGTRNKLEVLIQENLEAITEGLVESKKTK